LVAHADNAIVAITARTVRSGRSAQRGPGTEQIIAMAPVDRPVGEEDATRDIIGASSSSKLPAGLYLVATPIGNLGDMTARGIATLRAVDRIAAEDTRVARRLLAALAIRAPRLQRYDDHADAGMRTRLLDAIAAGEAVALVSDAGMPVIADPGFKLVRAARQRGLRVSIVPGASAPLAALALSGLPSDRFLFAGFLPSREAARRTALAELASVQATLVLLEAPQRLAASLADMATALGASREAVVARELTKMFEEVRAGPLGALAAATAAAPTPRGEVVVVVAPPNADEAAAAPDQATLDAQLQVALAKMSLRDAVAAVSGATGVARREVYARALALAGDRGT
jgi:16S rRNA (cytidine1402-2'-O)-methyltransferase